MARKKAKKDTNSLSSQINPLFLEIFKHAFPNNTEIIDNWAIISEQLIKVKLVHDSNTHKLGLDFLTEANRDIKSCETLNRKKLYPHATYHLQQAVEKLAKGYVLLEGFIKAQELREITTHQSPQVFIEAFIKKVGMKAVAEKLSDRTLITKINNAESTISAEGKRIEIAMASYSDILKQLSAIDPYHEMANQIDKVILGAMHNTNLDTLFTPSIIQTISKTIPSIATIFTLATITFPHEAYTRYPDRKITPEDYTGNLGIVRAIPAILKYTKAEIKTLINEHKEFNK